MDDHRAGAAADFGRADPWYLANDLARLIAFFLFLALVVWALASCATPGGPYLIGNPRCVLFCDALIVTQPVDNITTDDEIIEAKAEAAAKASATPPAKTP